MRGLNLSSSVLPTLSLAHLLLKLFTIVGLPCIGIQQNSEILILIYVLPFLNLFSQIHRYPVLPPMLALLNISLLLFQHGPIQALTAASYFSLSSNPSLKINPFNGMILACLHNQGSRTLTCPKLLLVLFLDFCQSNISYVQSFMYLDSLSITHSSFALTHNCFIFEDFLYLKMNGTVTSKHMAPKCANIFMTICFLKSCPLIQLVYTYGMLITSSSSGHRGRIFGKLRPSPISPPK